MKLDKAIEILTIHNDHNPNFTDAEREEAHQLGIEALEAIIEWRSSRDDDLLLTLPGETRNRKGG